MILPSFQDFSSKETNFYFHQFLSNFLKYFFSNFPSSHPYNILTVYFPDNSPLLISRQQKVNLVFFIFFLIFYFLFWFIFHFSIFRTLGLGLEVIGHISHIWWCGHNIDHRTWEKVIEDSGTRWCHITWTSYVGLMLYIWSFRVGCTVVSMDHL